MTKRRKEGRARKKSTSEDYGNDIHFFSLSASCFSRALRAFFSPLRPLLVSPAIHRRFPVLVSLDRAKMLEYTGWSTLGSYLKSFGTIGRSENF